MHKNRYVYVYRYVYIYTSQRKLIVNTPNHVKSNKVLKITNELKLKKLLM